MTSREQKEARLATRAWCLQTYLPSVVRNRKSDLVSAAGQRVMLGTARSLPASRDHSVPYRARSVDSSGPPTAPPIASSLQANSVPAPAPRRLPRGFGTRFRQQARGGRPMGRPEKESSRRDCGKRSIPNRGWSAHARLISAVVNRRSISIRWNQPCPQPLRISGRRLR